MLYFVWVLRRCARIGEGQGVEDCEEDVGVSRPRHDWESEYHCAVSTLLMRARDGNNGARVEQGSSIDTTDAAGCCIQLYIPPPQRKQRYLLFAPDLILYRRPGTRAK